jgi:hypothetical protein
MRNLIFVAALLGFEPAPPRLYVCAVTYSVPVRATSPGDALQAAKAAIESGELGSHTIECSRR